MQHIHYKKGGADFIIICTNTMHKVVEKIKENIHIPILHIADATAKEIKKKRYSNSWFAWN